MITNREQWLLALTAKLSPIFLEQGATIPVNVRISCGWPSVRALAGKSGLRRIGEVWHPQASADGSHEVFISPSIADPIAIGAVLVHELVHTCTPGKGHGKEFKRLALAVGLEGKMTATTASEALTKRLNAMVAEIGPYPHAVLDVTKRKKQSTRLLKAECTNGACEFAEYHGKPYSVRISATVFDFAAPQCGGCRESLAVKEKE